MSDNRMGHAGIPCERDALIYALGAISKSVADAFPEMVQVVDDAKLREKIMDVVIEGVADEGLAQPALIYLLVSGAMAVISEYTVGVDAPFRHQHGGRHGKT